MQNTNHKKRVRLLTPSGRATTRPGDGGNPTARAGQGVSVTSTQQLSAEPLPSQILTRCSCGCPLTREFWVRERDAKRTLTQVCDGCDHDLELARCPHCGSMRSIQIPTMRRGMLLALMPSIASFGGAA